MGRDIQIETWVRAPGMREEPVQRPNLESGWHRQSTEKRSVWSSSSEKERYRRSQTGSQGLDQEPYRPQLGSGFVLNTLGSLWTV